MITWYNQIMQTNTVFYLETEKIKPNPFQPRKEFNRESLEELANSIREFGILEPLIVSRVEKETETGRVVEYQLLAGERRLMAAKLVGLTTVPAIIRDNVEEREKLEIALIENLQREDLNAIERAKAFAELADKFNLSQREIAFKMGKSREFVANTLRLLQLPLEVQKALEAGKISEGHARIILSLEMPEQQKALLGRILAYNLTVRQTEESAKQLKKQFQTSFSGQEIFAPNFDPELEELENLLEEALKTRVILKKKGRKGMIAISFNSQEELENIIGRIIGNETNKPNYPEGSKEPLNKEWLDRHSSQFSESQNLPLSPSSPLTEISSNSPVPPITSESPKPPTENNFFPV